MPQYASQTTVSVSKSKSEIEDILLRYGCSEASPMIESGQVSRLPLTE